MNWLRNILWFSRVIHVLRMFAMVLKSLTNLFTEAIIETRKAATSVKSSCQPPSLNSLKKRAQCAANERKRAANALCPLS